MRLNLRRPTSVPAASSSQTPAKPAQPTTTTTTNDHSERSAVTEPPLLPAPVTAKDVPLRPSRNSKSVKFSGGFRAHWAAFKKKVASGTTPSTSSSPDDSTGTASYVLKPREFTSGEQDDHVDVVVVDRAWGEDPGWSNKGDSNTPLEEARAEDKLGTTSTDSGSSEADTNFWVSSPLLSFFRWRIWPPILGFFRLRFVDQKFEANYVKETWFLRKRLALFSALFFVVNWLLPVILITRPVTLADAIFYYGVGPAISIPLVFLVIFDYPRDHSFLYQIYLLFAVWSWPVYQVVYMHLCGFWNVNKPYVIYDCSQKDFLATFYYTSALQTIALFGLGMNRFPALLGLIFFLVTSLVLLLPVRPKYGRNAANVVIFEIFILYVHYVREVAERRLFTLRDQLKTQFKATQKAQVNERKAADSKRRLTSYVFHDTYSYLYTSWYNSIYPPPDIYRSEYLLAVQNMKVCNAVDESHEIEFKALEASLNMMSKVLNDVLDFHRMDSGKFESYNKPYVFHQVMRSLFAPLRLDADSKDLHFETELDGRIDDAAGRALFSELGHSEEEIQQALVKYDGVVLGDENRLRQIITNLAGNAFKFTPAGGTVTIKTKLVIPSADGPIKGSRSPSSPVPTPSVSQKSPPLSRSHSHKRPTKKGSPIEDKGKPGNSGLSADLLNQHNTIDNEKVKSLERIVVRIEVCDTGCGIHEKEMHEIKLFNAFNQTEVGRQQGGKGTGLGLALVRQIVKLSGGRLGLQSKVGEGSMFWVELQVLYEALGVGKKVLPSEEYPADSRTNSMDRPRSPASSQIHPEKVHTAPPTSTTLLERATGADGLVHLVPKHVDDRPQPVPALKESIQALKSRSFDRPPSKRYQHRATTSVDEKARVTSVWKRPETSTEASTSTEQDTPLSPGAVARRPRHIDLPKPPRFPTVRSPGDRLSPSLMRPPSPENAGSADVTPGLPILVVDDDRMTRLLMQRMLERLKCVVTTAVNGQQALELVTGMSDSCSVDTPESNEGEYFTDGRVPGLSTSRGTGDLHTPGLPEGKFAVVFLDNQMPVMSGVEMVKKLRKLGRKDLIVGVTGNALLPDQEEYLAAGADYILTKPVREESLRSMLLIADEQRKYRAVSPTLIGSPQNQNPVDNTST